MTGSTGYSYDANGHVTQKRQTAGAVTLTMTYGYDAGGRLANVAYPSGWHIVYSYDAAGRVSGVTASRQTLATGLTYMPFGMASGWSVGNGASYRRTIDQDGRITGLALPAADTIALNYDAASRITGIAETGQHAQNFSYDALNRLTNFTSGGATQAYTYDANGNRASYLDNATPPVSLAYTIDPASNRLLGIGGSWAGSFTYDAGGNMLSYSTPFSGYSFSYDARNRQTEAFVGAIGTSWLINGLGQRIAQVAAGVPQFYFVYDEAGHQTGKYDGSGNPLWETVWLGDLPVAVLQPGARFFVAPDHLGAPHQITDASGTVVWLWNHDPFGNGDPTGAFPYKLRFPGQFSDQSTKLHYNYFRDYDARTGGASAPHPLVLIEMTAMPNLTHLSAAGQAHMVDVSGKAATERVAIAEGRIVMAKATLDLALSGNAKKGDVFAAARIAAIMAAKKTHDLIPLCHPLALTQVSVDLEPDSALPGIRVRATAKVMGQTGVEMEALTAVAIACLTIYDMLKAVDRSMRIEGIALLRKSGGKSGDFSRGEASPT